MTETELSATRTSTVYGPVRSRRYGNSLGVDLLFVNSICSCRCAYCQLGKVNVPTLERHEWVPTDVVLSDLKASDWRKADVIAFSGNGEPTLALNLGEAIHEAKKVTKKPTVVLTNGTLLSDPSVRRDLKQSNEVSCKLDATDAEWFRRINRPVAGISFEILLDGIRKFRSEYKGKLTIQTMILPANHEKAEEFGAIIRDLGCDEVHLQVPIREVPHEWFLETRGDYQSPGDEAAFKTVSGAELMEIGRRIEAVSKVPVRTFPKHAAH